MKDKLKRLFDIGWDEVSVVMMDELGIDEWMRVERECRREMMAFRELFIYSIELVMDCLIELDVKSESIIEKIMKKIAERTRNIVVEYSEKEGRIVLEVFRKEFDLFIENYIIIITDYFVKIFAEA